MSESDGEMHGISATKESDPTSSNPDLRSLDSDVGHRLKSSHPYFFFPVQFFPQVIIRKVKFVLPDESTLVWHRRDESADAVAVQRRGGEIHA